jgi:peptidyl-prolyl cis-trans isomerase SurA
MKYIHLINLRRMGPAVALMLWIWAVGAPAAAGEIVDRIMAVVNDDIVTLSEFEELYQPYSRQAADREHLSDEDRVKLFKLRENVINQLIDQKLTDQEINRLRISVSEQEVDGAIARIREKSFVTDEEMRQRLKAEGVTMERYRMEMKNQILRAKLVDRQVKSNIIITEEDIQAYYDSHPEEFSGVKRLRLRNIFMRKPSQIGEEDTQAVSDRMDALLKRLEAGEDFADLARTHSESSNSLDGGELGLFELKDLAAPIRVALENKKKGEFTGMIDTEQGYQIFYVEDVVSEAGKPLEDVASAIEEALYKQTLDAKFSTWLVDLRERSHIKIID